MLKIYKLGININSNTNPPKMKKIITLAMLLATLSAWGQNYGTKIDPNDGFSDKLKKASATTRTITCGFEQTKHMSVLEKPAVSKGRFYYRPQQDICLEYSSPQGNMIVMSGGKLKIVNAGKSMIVDNQANPMMRQLSDMLTACMTGDIEMFGWEAVTEYFESAGLYTVVITPSNRRVKAYLKQIILSFDKRDMTLSAMRMSENDTDYTIYEFRDKILNGAIPEDKFKI